MTSPFESVEAPFIEIDTPAFRAVATSFTRLPFPIILKAMKGMESGNAVDQMEGVVAALEVALKPEDYKRLLELNVTELTAVIHDWVEPISGI